MNNQEGQPAIVLPNQTTIYDQLTPGAIEKRGQQNTTPPSQEVTLTGGILISKSGKICGVCSGTYIHEDKCTNQQLPLEGSNKPTLDNRQ